MAEEIKKGEFTSKYSIGEIVELKQKGSEHFCGRVQSVIFAEDAICPVYQVRGIDAHIFHFTENELCIRGVDYEINE